MPLNFSDEILMKPISRLLWLSSACWLASPTLQAGDFETQLSSETAQFVLHSDSALIGWGGADFTLGFFYNDKDDYLGQIGLMQMRQPSQQTRLTLGVGTRGYFGEVKTPNNSVSAVAIGGQIKYTIPGVMPMAFYGQMMYAPKITSFSDTETLSDSTVGFQIEALPQTVAYVGYRRLSVDWTSGQSSRLDDRHVHFGIRFTF